MVYPEIPACSSFYQHLVVADVPTLIRFVAILWAKTTLLVGQNDATGTK
jgi:hypothetical protein